VRALHADVDAEAIIEQLEAVLQIGLARGDGVGLVEQAAIRIA